MNLKNHKVSSSFIIFILLASVFSGVLLLSVSPVLSKPTGLVAHWTFDEGSGNTAADSSGNGNTGTLINSPVWVDGKIGKALSFNKVNTYVQVPQSSSLDVTTQVTVEAWVYPRAYLSSDGTDAHIVSRCSPNGGAIYVLGIFSSSGKVQYAVNPYPNAHSSAATLPLNTWTHLAMTYNGSGVALYINGVFDSSYALSGPIQTTSNWLAIGCKPTGPYGGAGTYAYFNGTIDDVRIYNRALSQQEIQLDMSGVPTPPSMSLVPSTGFASTTIVGSGFASNSIVTVAWDGTAIPTVPSPIVTDANGNFTAMISVPMQTSPGIHMVNVSDSSGSQASANFTVINMTGPQGPKGDTGLQGPKGDTGSQGPPGGAQESQLILTYSALAISILAIVIAVISLLRNRPKK